MICISFGAVYLRDHAQERLFVTARIAVAFVAPFYLPVADAVAVRRIKSARLPAALGRGWHDSP